MIITKQLIKKIDGLITDKPLIVRIYELLPGPLGVSTENIIILSIKLNVVLIKVVEEIIGTQNLCDLHKLIRIAVAMEEGFFPKDHRCKHGAKGPHVEGVVVFLEIDKKLWALVYDMLSFNFV